MRLGIGLAGAVLVFDQVTKWLLLYWVMDPPRVIPVLPFFNLVVVWNEGVSFGMFGGGAVPPAVFVGLSAAIAVAMLVWLRRADSLWTQLAIGLVVGGAIGNALDRLVFGAVFDFLDVHVAGWHWPAFNVADSAICIGVVLLLVESLLPERKAST